jgi:hypothetical protein
MDVNGQAVSIEIVAIEMQQTGTVEKLSEKFCISFFCTQGQ